MAFAQVAPTIDPGAGSVAVQAAKSAQNPNYTLWIVLGGVGLLSIVFLLKKYK